MSYEKPKRPAEVFRAGNIRIPVWSRTIEKEGRTFDVFSAQVQNQYYDEDLKEWRDSSSFNAGDLADLEICIRHARDFIRLRTNGGSPTEDKPAEVAAPQS